MQPMAMEHDASLNNAIDFVKETMFLSGPVPEIEITEEQTSNPADQQIKETNEVVDISPSIGNSAGKEVKDV